MGGGGIMGETHTKRNSALGDWVVRAGRRDPKTFVLGTREQTYERPECEEPLRKDSRAPRLSGLGEHTSVTVLWTPATATATRAHGGPREEAGTLTVPHHGASLPRWLNTPLPPVMVESSMSHRLPAKGSETQS